MPRPRDPCVVPAAHRRRHASVKEWVDKMLKCKPFMPNEADTCRTFVVPKLQASSWDADPHRIAEQGIVDVVERIMFGRRKHTKPSMAHEILCKLPNCSPPDIDSESIPRPWSGSC